MEIALLSFARQMPVAPLAKMAREHDTRIWRVIEHYVGSARAGLDYSAVTKVGMDETSARRGQDYVSIFMDLDEHRVLFATPGRDSETVKAFADDLTAHHGQPKTQLDAVCCDMSGAYIKGIAEHLSEPAQELPAPGPEPKVLASAAQAPQPDSSGGGEAPGPQPATPTPPAPKRPVVIFDRYHVVAVRHVAPCIRRGVKDPPLRAVAAAR
ncbi:MAG: ISL3 family transposase [Acidimicrobiales bacterium]